MDQCKPFKTPMVAGLKLKMPSDNENGIKNLQTPIEGIIGIMADHNLVIILIYPELLYPGVLENKKLLLHSRRKRNASPSRKPPRKQFSFLIFTKNSAA